MKETKVEKEKVILVGCETQNDAARFEYSMEELANLTKTANGQVVATLTQMRERIHPSTYIGKGKVEELESLAEELEADLIIFTLSFVPSVSAVEYDGRHAPRVIAARLP